MLVLQSYDSELPWIRSTTRGIRDAVKEFKGVKFTLEIEFLDLSREHNPLYRKKLKELIGLKYTDAPPDVLVCVDTLAAMFAIDFKSELFPEMPVVFSMTSKTYKELNRELPPRSAVVINGVDHAGTLALALNLFSDTRHVYIIGGQTKAGYFSENKLNQVSRKYKNRVQFHSLSHLAYDKILQTVESLPDDSVIFHLIFFTDINGNKYIPVRVIQAVSQRANAPVFSLYEPHISHGTLGGKMVSPESIGKNIVQLAAGLLKAPQQTAGKTISTPSLPIFDWRQLQKWEIKETNLPKGSIVRLKEYSFLEQHRNKVFFFICIVLLQATLIFFLIINLRLKKKAETSLQESQNRLKEKNEDLVLRDFIMDTAPVSVFWFNSKGAILYANKKAAASIGYSQTELLSLHIWDIDVTITKEGYAKIWQESEEGQPQHAESTQIRKDGSCFPIEINAQKNRHKNQLLLCGFLLDISERKAAQASLKASEQQHRSILRAAIDGFLVTNLNGDIIDINPAFCRLTGYSEAELSTMNISDVEAIDHPGHVSPRNPEMERKEKHRFEASYRHKNGRTLDVEVSCLYLENCKDRLFSFVRDLTEQKKIQAAFHQTQKMEAIGTLAGGIAHDFNNILGAILGYAEIVRLKALDDDNLIRSMDQILLAGKRAKDLVMQILLFSRKSKTEHMPLKIESLAKEVIALLRATLPANIEIQTSFSVRPGIIMADHAQIHQILMNLCTNAFHAMQEDNGLLTVTLKEVDLDKSSIALLPDLTPGRYICLKVSDTGSGIPAEIIDQIFDPFFTTKTEGKGTGLGLSVVHGIIKSHNGAIKVYSEPGKGTTFNVFLPSATIDETITDDLKHDLLIGKETVLFVDDETALVDIGQNMLEHLGYTVYGFSNSPQALRAFENNPDRFDIVVTDKNMPHMTGLQLAKAIRHKNPVIPIIMCTGFQDRLSDEQAQAAGINAIVNKPVLVAELAVLIRQQIKKTQ